jgi:hypothetical protein
VENKYRPEVGCEKLKGKCKNAEECSLQLYKTYTAIEFSAKYRSTNHTTKCDHIATWIPIAKQQLGIRLPT